MKKVAVAGLALAVLAGVVIAVSGRGASPRRVEREVVVAAPPEMVLEYVSDLRRWPEWSPRERLDPEVRRTYGGPARGVGSSYYWSGNERIGQGRRTVPAAAEGKVEVELELKQPRAVESDLEFRAVAAEGGSRVSLTVLGTHDLEGRSLGFFSSAEKKLGAELDAALAGIKELTEQQAREEAARVEQSISIAAPPAVVLAQLADVRRWSAWSPWGDAAAGVSRAYGGPASGAGASCFWKGEGSKGRITILANDAASVEAELEVLKPVPSLTDLRFVRVQDGAGTRVTATASGAAASHLEKALARLGAAPRAPGSQAVREPRR